MAGRAAVRAAHPAVRPHRGRGAQAAGRGRLLTGSAAAGGRDALLGRVVDHLASAGLTDLSLRALAAAVGTSHRMLLYHFGSVDGLVLAVVTEVERRQREFLAGLVAEPGLSSGEVSLRLWRRVSAPELRELVRLFFALYARLLQQGDADTAAELVRSWLEPAVAVPAAAGVAPERADAIARLGLAATRGLLLDLLATGEEARVDAAARTWAEALDLLVPA